MTVWKSNPRRLTPWTRQYFSGSPNSLVDVYAGKDEIVKACASDKEVIHFLSNCGEENLQFLLHPPRLQKALEILDTDKSGEVDREEWEEAINRGLAKRLQQLADERERRERAALAADAEFTAEFLSAARAVRSPRPIEPTSPRARLLASGVTSRVTRP